MQGFGVSAFIIPSTDPHASEYVADHWMTRAWISGFTGSAGTAVVTQNEAALWTDSRYFLQGEEQLSGTPFQLMKDGLPDTPSITAWLDAKLGREDVIGMEASVNTVADYRTWQAALGKERIKLCPVPDIWADRPPLPHSTIEQQPLQWAGETTKSKLQRVRSVMQEKGADALLITQLDEIAWLTNLRGADVHCTPVFIAYMLITTSEAFLFGPSPELLLKGEENFIVRPYDAIFNHLRGMSDCRVMVDTNTCNCALWDALTTHCTPVECASPIAAMKAIKNEAEIAGFRQAMLEEGVAMVRLWRWLEEAVPKGGVTEMGVDKKLTELRSQSPLFRGLSFDTIAAYGAHAAIVHYEATPESDIELKPKGFLLLDCGGQYTCGTTDVTRTIPLGPLTDEERLHYTLVLKGHLRLAMAKFPVGTAGTQLDVLARYAMWQEGVNYGHGTGHGVGSRLSVHEGPHQIRMQWRPAPLCAGATITNEPGIYLAGRHGIRTENTMLVKPYKTTPFGEFLQLEPLTLCPIDLTPVVPDMLLPDEIAYLQSYHQNVYNALSPLLSEDEKQWLLGFRFRG